MTNGLKQLDIAKREIFISENLDHPALSSIFAHFMTWRHIYLIYTDNGLSNIKEYFWDKNKFSEKSLIKFTQ